MSTNMNTTPLRMLYITSCTDAMMWYADRVGQFVPLMNRLPEGCWLSREPAGYSNIVHKLDAEEVTVLAPADKIGQWPYIQPTHKLVHIVSKDVAERARAGRSTDICRDACMLGGCRMLSDCQESHWFRLAHEAFADAKAQRLARAKASKPPPPPPPPPPPRSVKGAVPASTSPGPHPSAIKAALKAAASMWARVTGRQP